MLRPHGPVNFRSFLNRRKYIAIYHWLNFIYIVAYLPAGVWYRYLTLWGYVVNATVFSLLWLAHSVNGDFLKQRYEPPTELADHNKNDKNVLDPTLWPWCLWPWVHLAYEAALVFNTLIFVIFWFVEAPFLIYYEQWTSASGFNLFFFTTVYHTVPATLLVFEWWHNSIRVAMERLTLLYLIFYIYTLLYMYESLFVIAR